MLLFPSQTSLRSCDNLVHQLPRPTTATRNHILHPTLSIFGAAGGNPKAPGSSECGYIRVYHLSCTTDTLQDTGQHADNLARMPKNMNRIVELPAGVALTERSRKFYDGTYTWDSEGFTDDDGGNVDHELGGNIPTLTHLSVSCLRLL